MNTPKQDISKLLQKAFEPTKEELQNQFRAKVLDQIPLAEVSLRYDKQVPSKDRIKILGNEQAAEVLRSFWSPDTIELREEFKILYLNNSNQVLNLYPHSIGGITGTLADIRLIMSCALNCGAVGIILCHNHPSGSLSPSQSDITLTKKLIGAAKTLDLRILDHIILTKEDYYSMSERHDLDF